MKPQRQGKVLGARRVAPRRGAWVETYGGNKEEATARPSHPAGVRGLKPAEVSGGFGRGLVAPRRGAWVETVKKGS